MAMKKIKGAERKAIIIEAGAKLASKHGVKNVTRRMVAAAAKVSEALVSVHMGTSVAAQNAYGRKAKALGLTLPDKVQVEAIGKKLRAHGPRDARDTRKRSTKEVKAIRNKAGACVIKQKVATVPLQRELKPTAPRERKPAVPASKRITTPAVTRSAPERKATAARAPKAPPQLPQLPQVSAP